MSIEAETQNFNQVQAVEVVTSALEESHPNHTLLKSRVEEVVNNLAAGARIKYYIIPLAIHDLTNEVILPKPKIQNKEPYTPNFPINTVFTFKPFFVD